MELARLHLQQFLSHNSLLNASLKRKTDNISIILRHITTRERARAIGMLQQYVSITLPSV